MPPRRQKGSPPIRNPRPKQGAMQKQIRESVKRLRRSTTTQKKQGRQ